MDTIKVKIQLAKSKTSAMNIFTEIVTKDGFTGLYRGVVSPVIGNAPIIAILFAVNDLICGSLAGFCVSLIHTPIDLFKINKQVSTTRLSYFNILKHKYNNYGAKGLCQGFSPTFMRSMMPNGIMFATNSSIQDYLNTDPDKNSKTKLTLKKIIAGGISGQVFWISGYPFDVVKSFIQSCLKNVSMKAAFKFLYRRHGISYFYRGLSVTLLRAFPVSAINFVSYEYVSKRLK